MGRYANRFVAGGSNTIGATFTAADGGGNTAYAVAANGQSLSRTEYPGLARFYSGQTEFDTLKITAQATSTANDIWIYTITKTASNFSYGGGQVAASYGNFLLHMQKVQTLLPAGTGPYYAFWYTQDAENWKLVDTPSSVIGSSAGLVETTGGIYVCHSNGLHKTTDGTTFTQLYSSGVFTVADLGPTTVFVTGGTGIVKTNDFVNFTGVDIAAGFSPGSLVVHSGVLYAFGVTATDVYYSTNTGNTWTLAASGLPTGAGYYNLSTGGYLIVSTYDKATATPVFQYSVNPTGTTNTWTAVAATKSGMPESNTFATHIIYDSGTDNLIYCQNYILSNTSGIFAYTFTGITGAVTTYSGKGTNIVNGNITNSNYVAPFAFNISGKKGFCIGPAATVFPDASGTTWSGTRNFVLSSTSTNYRPNPFFHLSTAYNYGCYVLGTTNSGRRYIYKGSVDGNFEVNKQIGVFVEESGLFKPLKTSTGNFAFDNEAGYASLNGDTVACLAEASGRYILAWPSQVTTYSGLYYNSYSQSTLRSAGAGASGYANQMTSFAVLGATKSNGIYFFVSGGTQIGQNSALPVVITINPQGSTNQITSSLSYSGGQVTYSFSNLTNNVVLSAISTTGTVSGVALDFDGSSFTRNDYILTNATGGVVTPAIGTHIIQSNGKYYAIDPSGAIYKGASLGAFTFNNYTNRPPTGTITAAKRYTEISQTRTLGNGSILTNNYAGINISAVHTSPTGGVIGINRVDVWLYSGTTNYVVNAANRMPPAIAQTSGSGSFSVPNITSTVPGQAIYIIAR